MELIKSSGSTLSGDAKEGMISIRLRPAVHGIQRWIEWPTIFSSHKKANANAPIQLEHHNANANTSAPIQLEDEFGLILRKLASPRIYTKVKEPSGTNNSSSTGYSSITDSTTTTTGYAEEFNYVEYQFMSTRFKESMDELRSIASRMNSAGKLQECFKVYKSVQKSMVDLSFARLDIRKLSSNELRNLEWETLEAKVSQWIRAAKACVKFLFENEKRLFEQIFQGLGTAMDYFSSCFMEITNDSALRLFSFAEELIMGMRKRLKPEKLFRILDLHNALSDLLPHLLDVVSESIRIQAEKLLLQLAEAAREILSEFENDLLHDQSDFLDHTGNVHRLTVYVLNYVAHLSFYQKTLTKLIVSKPPYQKQEKLLLMNMEYSMEIEERTALEVHLILIIEILQFNLLGKSRCYSDNSLAQLFMLNNVHYIGQEIEVLREMVGHNYLDKLVQKISWLVTAYRSSTWDRIFSCLRDERSVQPYWTTFLPGGLLTKHMMRESLKTFNSMFQEVHQTQSTWVVPDLLLREKLRLSISMELFPIYASFLERFESHRGGGDGRGKYIRYSIEDLKAAISNFFEGRPVHQQTKTCCLEGK